VPLGRCTSWNIEKSRIRVRTGHHPLPGHPGWLSLVRRPMRGSPASTPCRRAYRSESWTLAWPYRRASSGVARLVRVLDFSSIPGLLLLPKHTKNQGSFPPPELPGFTGNTSPSDSHLGPKTAFLPPQLAAATRHRNGSHTLPRGPSVHATPTTPAENNGFAGRLLIR
jgi:hypothetical protein